MERLTHEALCRTKPKQTLRWYEEKPTAAVAFVPPAARPTVITLVV